MIPPHDVHGRVTSPAQAQIIMTITVNAGSLLIGLSAFNMKTDPSEVTGTAAGTYAGGILDISKVATWGVAHNAQALVYDATATLPDSFGEWFDEDFPASIHNLTTPIAANDVFTFTHLV